MSRPALLTRVRVPALAVTLALALGAQASPAVAEGLEGGPIWRLEQPQPPKPPPGVQESSIPVGLGKIGDIEFFAPNRGLLITAGNPPTIPPSVWAYNGVEWHDLADVCGGAEHEEEGGRIAWAGPGEFWTVSVGRPGQTSASSEHPEPPPLIDNTLCHFAGGKVLASYAHPAFEADSYQVMQAAACFPGGSDCWFAGSPLPEPQVGAFQLHWNGSSLEGEPYAAEGHAVEDMRALGDHLYESVRLAPGDRSAAQEANPEPPIVHRIEPAGVLPAVEPEALPFFEPTLDFLHLSAAEEALWGAAGPQRQEAGAPAVTVVRRSEGSWSELIGPSANPLGVGIFPDEPALFPEGAEHAAVRSIAAAPGTQSAWIALAPKTQSSGELAALVRVSTEGRVLEEATLPSGSEQQAGIARKGAAAKIACPAANDCWLATSEGWLFHLAPEGERTQPRDENESEYFTGLITFRPPDLGLPQVAPDAPPADTSGLLEEAPDYGGAFAESPAPAAAQSKVALPLLSHMHSRLVHGSTLELLFHLAVKARIRLIAKRHSRVVAATPLRTFKAGNRSLLLRLNPRSWPTKLSLQTRALAPLPLVSSVTGEGANVTTETTSLFVLPHTSPFTGSGSLP